MNAFQNVTLFSSMSQRLYIHLIFNVDSSLRLYIHLIFNVDSSLCQINLDWNQVPHRTFTLTLYTFNTAPV
jgi:hypothetical protein